MAHGIQAADVAFTPSNNITIGSTVTIRATLTNTTESTEYVKWRCRFRDSSGNDLCSCADVTASAKAGESITVFFTMYFSSDALNQLIGSSTSKTITNYRWWFNGYDKMMVEVQMAQAQQFQA